jgi:hypothetical protein
MQKNISAGQNLLAAYQKEEKSKISAINAGHSKFKETITNT